MNPFDWFCMTPSIIPIPAEFSIRDEAPFVINSRTSIVVSGRNTALRAVGRLLGGLLGLSVFEEDRPQAIGLSINPRLKKALGREGYRLTSCAKGVSIVAATAQGVFYGIQSLRQLLPLEIEQLGVGAVQELSVPALRITDRPRFGWRGAMLDVARHHLSLAEIKRFLDAMALHKLNVMHWHLVDDQGWRLEIKRFPKLTEVGAWRKQSPRHGNRKEGDGIPYGGYYTQEQVREIVAYAAERYITVVPEIEMPGHAASALAAYPQFGNRDVPGYAPAVADFWGIKPFTYSPCEATFEFLSGILTEVAELFPSRYIHIGADEAIKDQWKQSAIAQKIIKKHGLKDEYELQGWFVRRIENILAGLGRRLIGWDEINEGGLSPKATMMVWRDWKWAQEAIENGNNVIMSPRTHCYLDYYQADPATNDEPEAIGGLLTLETAYSFNPIPEGISDARQRQVLGIQGNLWSEYLPNARQMEYMAFPRLTALAEVAWSPLESKDWAGFRQRLQPMLKRLELLGINYRPEK